MLHDGCLKLKPSKPLTRSPWAELVHPAHCACITKTGPSCFGVAEYGFLPNLHQHEDQPQKHIFLSSLDMDLAATGHAGGSLISPGASRVTLPLGGSNDIFGSVAAGPGLSRPSTTDSIDAGGKMDMH